MNRSWISRMALALTLGGSLVAGLGGWAQHSALPGKAANLAGNINPPGPTASVHLR